MLIFRQKIGIANTLFLLSFLGPPPKEGGLKLTINEFTLSF